MRATFERSAGDCIARPAASIASASIPITPWEGCPVGDRAVHICDRRAATTVVEATSLDVGDTTQFALSAHLTPRRDWADYVARLATRLMSSAPVCRSFDVYCPGRQMAVTRTAHVRGVATTVPVSGRMRTVGPKGRGAGSARDPLHAPGIRSTSVVKVVVEGAEPH